MDHWSRLRFELRCATPHSLYISSIMPENDSVQRQQNKSGDGCLTGARQPVSFCNVSQAHRGSGASGASVLSSDLLNQPSSLDRRGQTERGSGCDLTGDDSEVWCWRFHLNEPWLWLKTDNVGRESSSACLWRYLDSVYMC